MELRKGIFWTGFIDWNLSVFHGYTTPYGTTYNAYIIRDEKPTLIDSVKHYGFNEMIERIKAIMDPSEIRYIVANHAEGDHSGSINKLIKLCPEAEIICSPKAVDILKKMYKEDWRFHPVQNGESIKIGKRDLRFVHMPMVHWPESMSTYCPQEKILFSNDGFGQHYASSERFADELPLDIVYQEAAKYYGNIVMPYGNQTLKLLNDVKDLPIDMICSSHGLIWRREEDIKEILRLYAKWANHETDRKVLIVYDTMYHSTEKMALRFEELLEKKGIPSRLMNLEKFHISDIVTEVLTSNYVLFGSPILNNRILPTMAALLMYLKGLKPKNRKSLAFGSFGWSTVGFKEFEEQLREAGFSLLGEGAYYKFAPDAEELEGLSKYIDQIN